MFKTKIKQINTNNTVANTQMIWVDDGAGKGHLQITITGDST